MKPRLARGLLYSCLFLVAQAFQGHAQSTATPSQTPAAPQAPPAGQPAPRPQIQGQEENSGEGAISVQLYYWLTTTANPKMGAGSQHVATTPGDLDAMGKSKPSPGIVVSFPAGKDNSIRISYFRTQGDGNTTATKDLNLFSTDYTAGDYLATRYTLQDAKVSLDFLSYPTPIEGHKFRFKTLWEVQYVTIYSSVDAPLKPVAVDSSGTAISNTGEATKWFIFPSLGAAIEHTVSRNFRWEARFSGFGIPHHAALWDAQAFAAFRVDRVEVTAGYKGFFFKTSPNADQFLKATLSGAYVGVTWYPRW